MNGNGIDNQNNDKPQDLLEQHVDNDNSQVIVFSHGEDGLKTDKARKTLRAWLATKKQQVFSAAEAE